MKSLSTQVREYLTQKPDRFTNILAEIKGNRFYITYNRPQKYNAFSSEMYDTLAEYISKANEL
jgi:enoyl-CoA hydratase/carnithine racemase